MSDSLSRRSFLSLAGGTAVALAGLGLVGCGGSSSSNAGSDSASSDSSAKSLSGTVNCSGATSFQPLVEAAAKKFEDENPDVTIAITGGGSGQGLSDVRDGKAQIGRSDVFAEEKLDASDVARPLPTTPCAWLAWAPS
jgi:phosphate transport system substrate-binding protein